jgi:hypothetical protein
VGQNQLRDGEEIEMSDNDADACSETDKLLNHSNGLLNMIWKMMQEGKIEWESECDLSHVDKVDVFPALYGAPSVCVGAKCR